MVLITKRLYLLLFFIFIILILASSSFARPIEYDSKVTFQELGLNDIKGIKDYGNLVSFPYLTLDINIPIPKRFEDYSSEDGNVCIYLEGDAANNSGSSFTLIKLNGYTLFKGKDFIHPKNCFKIFNIKDVIDFGKENVLSVKIRHNITDVAIVNYNIKKESYFSFFMPHFELEDLNIPKDFRAGKKHEISFNVKNIDPVDVDVTANLKESDMTNISSVNVSLKGNYDTYNSKKKVIIRFDTPKEPGKYYLGSILVSGGGYELTKDLGIIDVKPEDKKDKKKLSPENFEGNVEEKPKEVVKTKQESLKGTPLTQTINLLIILAIVVVICFTILTILKNRKKSRKKH